MSKKTIVILGSGEAVKVAAARARDVNHEARILIFENTAPEEVSLDMDARAVTIKTEAKPKRIGFDSLIYCEGIRSRSTAIEGLLQSEIGCASNNKNEFANSKSVAVLGCGRDGIAISQRLRSEGVAVTMFEKSPRVLPRNSFEAAQRALQSLKALGITVRLQEEIARAEKLPNGVFRLWTSKGHALDVDLVISAIGAEPVNALLANAGAMTGKDGTVFVDDTMSTTLNGVYACGEAISAVKAISLTRQFRPSESIIERGAQVAGANAASCHFNSVERMRPCAGLEIQQIGELYIARTGLSHVELHNQQSTDDYVRATVISNNEMLRLYASRETGAIIGGEIVGGSDSACHIKLISMCVLKHLKANDLIDLDVPSTIREAAEHIRSALNLEFESVSGEKVVLWLAQHREINWLDVGEKPSSILNRFKSAKHVPLKDMKKKMPNLSREVPLILTSESGRSAIQACRVFKKEGFEQVFQLEGGSHALNLLLGDNGNN